MGYRLANVGWGLLLLYAAAVQYNDPDPLRWIFLYGAGALFCGVAAAVGWVPPRPVLAYAAMCAAVAAVNAVWGEGLPRMGMGGSEITRETLGLSLMAAWLVALAVWTHRRGRPAPETRT